MSFYTFAGMGTTSFWLFEREGSFDSTTQKGYKQLGNFSPTTDWEKVFTLGDSINRELRINEKEIKDEISAYRATKKR